jgi:putative methyltransferase (TIGR04325 family)
MSADLDFNIWEGVYRSFAEAPANGPGFDGSTWRERSVQAAHDALACLPTREPLDYALRQRNAVLPTLTAAILVTQPAVSILDFGGGLGTGYIVVAKALPNAGDRVDYAVVDNESICRAGREVFAGRKNPVFHITSPATSTDAASFDIVHAASAMQYIEDWRGLLKLLADYGARYLSLADLFIGDFSSFVTLQNYYGSQIRQWFLNADDFVGEVERNGYQLALRLECDGKALGRHGQLPMKNFPPPLRIANTSNLLFCRRGAGP